MEVDIILEPDLGPAQLLELAVAAEKYGIRALWTANYFAHWDPFISLVPVAQATKRLKMGALAVLSMENYLAQLGAWVSIAQGLIFIVCVLTFRRGLVGELGRLLRKSL